MSAQDILARRMAEVESRAHDKKQAIAELFEAYPFFRDRLKNLKDAGFPVTVGAMEWTIHGPTRHHTGYAATVSSHATPQSLPKKEKAGSGVRMKRYNR